MSSFLGKECVDSVLSTVRTNMAQDGHLIPVLIMLVRRAGEVPVPVVLGLYDFPATAEGRYAHLYGVGALTRRNGEDIQAALLLMDGWFVKASSTDEALKVRPSQHPERREAIVLMGRSADGTRQTSFVQLYTRGATGSIVWEEPEIVRYDEPITGGRHFLGLIDSLFVVPRMA